VVAGAAVNSALSITGGSGNDTIAGGNIADTITGGVGVDNLTGNNGVDVFVFNVGDSNPVYSGIAVTASGQDTITANSTDASQQLLQFNITSADTVWAMDHILVGTAANAIIAAPGTNTAANTDAFAATAVLVQAGTTAAAAANNADAFDIVLNVATGLTAAQAQAMAVINLTGTVGADSLTTGVNNDTIAGGAGNDTITGGAGADTIDVGSSTTNIDVVVQGTAGGANGGSGASGTFSLGASNTVAATNFDIVRGMGAGDIIALVQYTNASAGTAADQVLVNTTPTVQTTVATGTWTLANNTVNLVRGNFTAATLTAASSFIGSSSGSDLLVVYDAHSANATQAYEAIVLIGVGTNTATIGAAAGGSITLV
jgi:hypothetical protein